jgi:hypothetical protein
MTEQNYLLIDLQNIVENIVVWDGGSDWFPPAGYLALPQATTPAMVWNLNTKVTPPVYELVEVMGVGNIGFSWNGTVLTTNNPKPEIPST